MASTPDPRTCTVSAASYPALPPGATPSRCDGCGMDDQPTAPYAVTYHEAVLAHARALDPATAAEEIAQYCAECATLAEGDWAGTMAAVRPLAARGAY